MPVFQVASRIVQAGDRPAKRASRARHRWYAVLRYIDGVNMAGGAFALLVVFLHAQWLFVLLPADVAIVITAITAITTTRPHYLKALLLTAGMAILFFGGITAFELLTEGPGTAEIVVVATTLTAVVVFEPVRAFVQAAIERRLRLREDETTRTVEAFTAALREEIDLDQVRERFLDVVQAMLQPCSTSLWVRATAQDGAEGASATIDDADPLLAYVLSRPEALETDRPRLDSPALRIWQADGVELVLPLTSQGELLGLLLLGSRLRAPTPAVNRVLDVIALLTVGGPVHLLSLGVRPHAREYAREERAVLATLAAQVAPALRVAQMVRAQEAQVRERERIEQELRTAQRIQRTFLPKELPATPGWQLVPYYQPAREVGGDFYDLLPLEDGWLGVVIGDVTGKGMPAALVMVATRTMLRTAVQENAAPAAVLARVNATLAADVPPGMFATCFFALLDLPSGRMRYANAGHDLPCLRRADGSVEELHATGMPLGLMPEMRYEEKETTLAPGEGLLLYSDGLVEAHNPAREMFGRERVQALVSEHTGGAALIAALSHALGDFTGAGREQEDDVTLVALSRAAGDESFVAAPAAATSSDVPAESPGWHTLG